MNFGNFLNRINSVKTLGLFQKITLLVVNGVMLLFALYYLSGEKKGLYFSIMAICGASTIFEMGFCYTLVQKISLLSAGVDRFESIKKKLGTYYLAMEHVFKYSVLYAFFSIVIFWYFLINPGYYSQGELVIPVISVLSGFLFKLVAQVHEAFVEASGDIKSVLIGRSLAAIFAGAVSILTLVIYPALAPGFYYSTIGLTSLIYFGFRRRRGFSPAKVLGFKIYKTNSLNLKDIYARKIAFSWISGYIIYQSLPLVEMKFHGPISAGMYGVLNSISIALIGVSNSFVSVSTFATAELFINSINSKLIKSRIFILMIQTGCIFLLCTSLIGALIIFGSYWFDYSTKFPPLGSIVLVLITSFLVSQISVAALFLRARLSDPLFFSSLIQAVLTIIIATVCVPMFELYGVVLAYCLPVFLVGAPFAFIYLRFFMRNL